MMRFIDLRGQINTEIDDSGEPLPIEEQEPHFAFYDTIPDSFVCLNGNYTWNSRNELLCDAAGSYGLSTRLLRLLPDWVPFSTSVEK